MADFVSVVLGAAATLAIKDGIPWLRRAYEQRYVDPHRAHQNLCLEKAKWYGQRADKLAAFRHELIFSPPRDKFKLAFLIAQLDRKDQDWAMKETDIEVLQESAAHKGNECQQNASECARDADEINYRTFIFPIA
jgi:hypothetical protein